jgi:hypothetical protein
MSCQMRLREGLSRGAHAQRQVRALVVTAGGIVIGTAQCPRRRNLCCTVHQCSVILSLVSSLQLYHGVAFLLRILRQPEAFSSAGHSMARPA